MDCAIGKKGEWGSLSIIKLRLNAVFPPLSSSLQQELRATLFKNSFPANYYRRISCHKKFNSNRFCCYSESSKATQRHTSCYRWNCMQLKGLTSSSSSREANMYKIATAVKLPASHEWIGSDRINCYHFATSGLIKLRIALRPLCFQVVSVSVAHIFMHITL